MRVRQTFLMRVFSMRVFALFLVVGVGVGLHLSELVVYAQMTDDTPIPAVKAFDGPEKCSNTELTNAHDEARFLPEWKPIIFSSDPRYQLPNNPPTILEGTVSPPPEGENSGSQASSEVAEEDLPWNHYTHDFGVKIIPDLGYHHLLSSWVDLTDGMIHVHPDMEFEWDNASLMDESEGFQRIWGAVPEFVWPAVGDRVWVEGRWIFDCGHVGNVANDDDTAHVQFSTEIHPPRALVTFRLNHPALDSFPVPRTSAPNFPGLQSFLPVTGEPATTLPPGVPDSGPTNVPVTEADIFVSVNGGGANDFCSIVGSSSCGDIFTCLSDFSDCHTGPIIPVNDRNYVFDIYPPGTNYHSLLSDGTFRVTPPVTDASLQWRTVDHFDELPAHACGGKDNKVCVTVDPIICLIDGSTPPPPQDQSQTGTTCPSVPAQPTRLRVILPFAGTNANFFAQSILLGWDDVPGGSQQILLASANTKANVFARSILLGQVGLPGPVTTPIVRSFKVTLNQFDVLDNANQICVPNVGCVDLLPADWRVFVNVGGQYRYISQLFDGGPLFGTGNPCNGDALTSAFNGNCFRFHDTAWKVSVVDGTPIHVAVGGFAANGTLEGDFCRNYVPPSPPPDLPFDIPVFGGCNFSALGAGKDLALNSFKRIGTYEFDLCKNEIIGRSCGGPDYAPPAAFTTQSTGGEQYKVEFSVLEIPAATAPTSALQIGNPHYNQFVSSATPLVLSTASTDAEGFQYRFHQQGGPLPTYTSPLPFPVHWTSAPIDPGSHSLSLGLHGVDGPYLLQFSGETFGNLLEIRHNESLILDNTPPVISIVQPQPTTYPHSAVLTLNYSVTDAGSGVNQFTASMDGSTTLLLMGQTKTLINGLAFNLLNLTLGPHTFSITALDNVSNANTSSVTFTIVVTPESIKGDVTYFLQSGAIKNEGVADSLLAKLDAAAKAFAAGNCATADNIYQAFINELNAQSGKGVDATAAAIMIADAQYLMAHCPN